jgi:hypothetical protein
MKPRSAIGLFVLASLVRVFGGAVTLWLLDAPAWAIAAWLFVHIKVELDLSKLRARS